MGDLSGPKVAVFGAGAVGCYFGAMLARAGIPVTLIARARHVEAINQHGLRLERGEGHEHVPVRAATEVSAVRPAEVVLVSVKTPDTESAAYALAPHLATGAMVVSLQNGVDNAARLRAAIPGAVVVSAVVYVAAAMTAPGCVTHTGRGDLIVGIEGRPDPTMERRLAEIATLFGRAGVPCRVSATIEADLWTKLIMNCAYNALAAVTRMRYGRLAHDPAIRQVMKAVVEEILAVAQAAGIALSTDVDYVSAAWQLADGMPDATSSTAQDLARGKRTEIDALNGYVVRRGAQLGISTPVNQALHALVKLLEDEATRPTT